jgi:hypothetical protein
VKYQRDLVNLVVGPTLCMLIGGAQRTSTLAGLSNAYLSSPKVKSQVQDMLAGEKNSTKARTGGSSSTKGEGF